MVDILGWVGWSDVGERIIIGKLLIVTLISWLDQLTNEFINIVIFISVRILELILISESRQVFTWLLFVDLLASFSSLFLQLALNLFLDILTLSNERFGTHNIIIFIDHLLERIKLEDSLNLLVELFLLLLGQLCRSLNHPVHELFHDILRLLRWK